MFFEDVAEPAAFVTKAFKKCVSIWERPLLCNGCTSLSSAEGQ